jgi:hypothetical protein
LQASFCDFNGDNFDDQAIGIPGESVAGVADMGAVQVIYGGRTGLAVAGNDLWHQDSLRIEDQGELGDRFGEAIACGDFDNDGFDDLAVGVLGEEVTAADQGAVNVIYGSAAGLDAPDNDFWTQDSAGILGTAESRDRFGSALAAGDFDGDGFDDLAVGAPSEAVGDLSLAGSVNVIYGSAAGLASAGNQIIHQDIGGIVGVAEERDRFGAALAAGDFDNDGFDDLAIGVPAENEGDDIGDSGAINVIYGAAGGLTTTGNEIFTQTTSGIQGVAEDSDAMGWSLVSGDFNGDGRDDLAAGAPGEDIGDIESAGAVHVIYGAAAGLSSAGNDLFWQGNAGVLGGAEAFDRFGESLAAGDFNNDGRDDLAVGAPFDSVAGVPEIGVANVLHGGAAGISTAGDQFWHQNQANIEGVAEPFDRLAETLATGDYNGDGRADLALGASGESVGDISDVGAVNVLYGRAGGALTSANDQLWHQGIAGIVGDPETRDRASARLRSDNTYQIPYADGTDVRVNGDRLTHSPPDRVDLKGDGVFNLIVAARAGTIEIIVDSNSEPTSNNNYVWISHGNGEWSKYTHFVTDSVTDAGRFEGEDVSAGTLLGLEGDVGQATGVHLHFEIAVPYDPSDPVNAGGFIKGENRDPVICGIPGNTLVAGQTYEAGPC